MTQQACNSEKDVDELASSMQSLKFQIQVQPLPSPSLSTSQPFLRPSPKAELADHVFLLF